MGYKSWRKLDSGVKKVVAELAEIQRFKCALCPATSNLIIDHDHYPEEGPGYPYTVFNIRGLVCSRCNWHLMVYEKNENGEYLGWENADSLISHHEYESYDFRYRCRVRPLVEEALEARMGSRNYSRRHTCLEKFDAWYYDGERSAWREEWEKRRAWEIKTPEQFIERVQAFIRFYNEQMDKDSDFVLPDEVLKLVVKTQKFFRDVLAEVSAGKDATVRVTG